jgi:Uma2 family endonuclease
LLRILPEFGGRTWNEGGFVHGAPELVVEIAKATRYADFGPRLDDYQRAGVTEYVIRAFELNEICWFSLDQGTQVQRTVGDGGLYRSTVFPGLWLDPEALLNGDTQRLRAIVDLGCATADHTAFVARLAGARRQS